MKQITKYHYTECGLDHVYIHGINIEDDNHNKNTQLVALGLLHTLISLELINKSGQFNNKEIFFLRYELSLTRKQLADKIDISEDKITSCEIDDNTKLDIDVENKFRNLVFKFIKTKAIKSILKDKELCQLKSNVLNTPQLDINIKLTNNKKLPYTTLKKAA